MQYGLITVKVLFLIVMDEVQKRKIVIPFADGSFKVSPTENVIFIKNVKIRQKLQYRYTAVVIEKKPYQLLFPVTV